MKKTYISTYCDATSFGSILQSLGLKNFLAKMDIESELIRIGAKRQKEKVVFTKSLNPKAIIKNAYLLAHKKKIEKSRRKNNDFIEKNINLRVYDSYELLATDNSYADFYIAGSDQIWHPDLCKKDFFLEHAPKNKLKVSYSASMGKTQISKEKEDIFAQLLKNFDKVSVRELDMVDIVKKYVDKEINVNIDPTFLCTSEEWKGYQKPYKLNKKFILVYPIYWDCSVNACLKQLHKQTGYDIVVISSGLKNIYYNKILFDVGTDEFLWLIDNAQAIVTSSFHGVAFSTIFNKNFSALVNPNLPSRINSLLNKLGVEPLPIQDLCTKQIDYSLVNKNIIKATININKNN